MSVALVGGVGPANPGRSSARALPLLVGAVLLALIVAGSTAQAGWISGSGGLTGLALVAVVCGCLLALANVRPLLAGALVALSAPVAAYSAAGVAPEQVGRWGSLFVSGHISEAPSLLLFLLCLLFWLLSAWMGWGILRRQQPLLGIAPAGAALATNVLNFPQDQDAYVFEFLVVTLGLLLWSTYQGSLAAAAARGIELAEAVRWDFWERGALAMAALVALAVLAPPLSAVDRTVDIENGLSTSWGEVTHGGRGGGHGGGTSIGFSLNAPLGGSLQQSAGLVFTYSADANAPGPNYFRGVTMAPFLNEWTFASTLGSTSRGAMGSLSLAPDEPVSYENGITSTGRATFSVTVVRPPRALPEMIFFPGQLDTVDRTVQVVQSVGPSTNAGQIETVDKVISREAGGSYKVRVEESTATVEDLRAASTKYPPWAKQYVGLPYEYRSSLVRNQVHDLAVSVTEGASNPYDQATAIESFLRDNYAYTLHPGDPPKGEDPEQYFLFSRKAGFCQYFATAMGDMLRSLGIPTRLVSGFGPGTYDEKLHRYVVRESDSHVWPEVYFPGYGWIPFEPTPDPNYPTITRGTVSSPSDSPSPGAEATPSPAAPRTRPEPGDTGSASKAPFGLPTLRTWTPVGAVILVLLVLLYVGLSRYLRPQTVAAVWKRSTRLIELAGVSPRPSETPIEFGNRVATQLPEVAAPIRQLAVDFTVAAYAPLGLAEQRRPAVMAGWRALRPLLLRRIGARLVPQRLAPARQTGTASPV